MILSDAELGPPPPLRLDHLTTPVQMHGDGYVYVMGVWDKKDGCLGDLVKVGLSNDPAYRLLQIHREIQRTDEGWRAKPFLYLTVAVRNMAEVEGLAHYALRRRREWGEWFGYSLSRAAKVLLAVERRCGKPHRPIPKEWLE